jgi:GT2 family glycosyltransferase
VPDVVISVVCTNNRAALEQCLAALPAACDGLSWTATVIDNASTDGTSEMVQRRYPWAHLVRREHRAGFSANHNRTLDRVVRDRSADYALILNDDTIFDPGAVAAMVREMEERRSLGALGPRLRGLDGRPQQSLFRFPSVRDFALDVMLPSRPTGPAGRDGWLNGSCILFRLEALACVGVLDERFFIFFEDTDICLRLRDAGWSSAIAASAGMVHLEHQTVSKPALNSMMARQMLRSQWLYLRKHNGRLGAAAVAVAWRVILLLRALRDLARWSHSDDPTIRERALDLIRLAGYQVRVPLPHERSSQPTG